MAPNRGLREVLARHSLKLIFHDCGESHIGYAAAIRGGTAACSAEPGRQPDRAMPAEEVRRMTREIVRRMAGGGS